MDGEEVSSDTATTEVNITEDGQSNSSSSVSYSKTIRDCLPYYLSIGMTYDQYMNGEPNLVVAYRKANEICERRENYKAWLQGRYVYDAICETSPILRAFSKESEPLPYTEKPYPLTADEQKERNAKATKKAAEMFALLVESKNKELKRKNGADN